MLSCYCLLCWEFDQLTYGYTAATGHERGAYLVGKW